MSKKLTGPVLLIEGGMSDANLRYACGFTAPDPVVYVKKGGRSFLVVSVLEAGRARHEARVTQVITPPALSLPKRHRRNLYRWALALLKRERIQRVAVSPDFPVAGADLLRRNGIRVVVADGPLFPGREIKRSYEVEQIRVVQKAAVSAMRRAVELIRSSETGRGNVLRIGKRRLTSEEVRREIETTLLQHDCVAFDTIVAGGQQGADPHERGHGPLKGGEPIVIDIFPRHRVTGYWGDITRTVAKGEPPEEVRRLYGAVRAAQRHALSRIRPGVSGQAVHRDVADLFRARGYRTQIRGNVPEGFIHGTGHGVGLDIHEAPSISLAETKLRAGQVVTVEPGLYYPRWGGVRIEDTVVVTRTGWRYLAACPKTFII